MSRFDLRPRLTAAADILGYEIDGDPDDWFDLNWKNHKFTLAVHAPEEKDSILRIRNGTYKGRPRPEHLQIIHRVLRLHEYGIPLEEVLTLDEDDPEDGFLPKFDGFCAVLKSRRAQHVDPLKPLEKYGDDRFQMVIKSWPIAVPQIWGNEVQHRDPAPVDHRVKSGHQLEVTPAAQQPGQLLLLSVNPANSAFLILNEAMGKDRNTRYDPGEEPEFRAPATGDPGLRKLVVVNWPEGLDPAVYGLEGLFRRKDLTLSERELRSLMAAVADTAEAAPGNPRAHARMRPIMLVE